MKKVTAILFGIILVLGISIPSQGGTQEIDPFYFQRLSIGEKAFLEGDYETAITELEIAVFGIEGDKQLKAKAYLYLGMSHYYLDNKDEAEKNLKDAVNILGMEGLRGMVPDESLWLYLNRVLVDLKLMAPQKKQAAGTAVITPMKKPVEKEGSISSASALTATLERQIRSNPRNVSLYYDLYEHHKANNRTGAAKKTLENLIKRNPNDAKGYYLLGKIQYQQRELRDAEKNLGKVFELEEKAPVDEFVILESKIYQILTVLLQGEKQKAYRMYAAWSALLKEEKIRYLDLEEQDRGIFQGIMQSEAAQAEIDKLKSLEENAGEVSEPEQKRGEEQGTERAGDTSVAAGVDPKADLNIETAENTEFIENVVPLDQVDTPPMLRERVDPKYPTAAVKRQIEGIVIVNALISESGDVMDVVVAQGLAGGFNEKTVEAVRQWKYEPAVKDGQKVKVWKRITITFRTR